MNIYQAGALYAGYVALLHIIPGPWRHWSRGKIFDEWMLTHLAGGVVAQYLGVSYKDYLILSVGNEAVEAGIRKYRPDLLWGEPESFGNVIGDLATGFLGYEATRRLRRLPG